MRVVVVGGSGHVGTYLVPRLVESGHEVVCVSRGRTGPYRDHAAWGSVEHVVLDREEEEGRGTFGERLLALRPEAVVDMICFTPESAQYLAETLRGRVGHLLHCGTIWVHGHSTVVPATEDLPRRPFGHYGAMKARIEAYLLEEARRGGLPVTVLHPGHIVGPGWAPLNPAGNFDPRVFERLLRGEELLLPNLGMETVHHVHADDVAAAFALALKNPRAALGESFHVVSPAALTLRGYAEGVAATYGRQPRLRFLSWEAWREGVAEGEAAATWDHIAHSPNCSIEKARRLLGYSPRYGSLEAVRESLDWLIEHGKVSAG